MLVPQGRVDVSGAVPVRRLRFAALPGLAQTSSAHVSLALVTQLQALASAYSIKSAVCTK
jgi:hypothetical protein